MWYEERRAGLGPDFIAEVTAVLGKIGGTPNAFPLWPGLDPIRKPFRRAVIHRFPYVVAFQAHADHVLVLAVAHAKRTPLYWLARAR